jgi:DNA-binding Lrp family transcriptional regulator
MFNIVKNEVVAMMMNESDLKILAHLRQNSRARLKEISKGTNVPISTIFERIRGMLSSCVSKYTFVLNNSELGFTSRATLILKVDKEQKKELGSFLNKQENVNSLYRINNGYDFLLDVIFRNMIELEEFIDCLEKNYKIKHKEVYFIIDEIKQEGFLSDPEGVSLLFGEKTV